MTNQKVQDSMVKDSDIYVMNPLVRMRNEKHGVELYGLLWSNQNITLHHSWGVTLALFDGERTVEEVSKLVIPFIENPEAEDALDVAKRHVQGFVEQFTKTYEEWKGDPVNPTDFPSQTTLVPVSMLKEFGNSPRPSYDPYQLTPEKAYPEAAYANDPKTSKRRAPTNITWHVTSDCATDCRYCYLGRRKLEPSQFLSKERALELIREAHDMGVHEIALTGGDVLLYPHLCEVLEALHEYKFLPMVLPSKAYLGKEMAKRLAQYGTVWGIQFSIDSTVEEIADWLVRRPGFYRKTMESIDHALQAGIRVTGKAVVTPYNILTIPRLYRELRHRGVQSVRLATYVRSGYHHTDDLFLSPENYSWLEGELAVLRKEFPGDHITMQNGAPILEPPAKEQLQARWADRAGCSAGRSQMMICADGKVIPCEQMPETEEVFCGDVKTQSIQEVWESRELDEIAVHLPRDKFKGTVCYDCEEREECHWSKGYCYRDCYTIYGSMHVPPPTCPKNDLPFVRQM